MEPGGQGSERRSSGVISSRLKRGCQRLADRLKANARTGLYRLSRLTQRGGNKEHTKGMSLKRYARCIDEDETRELTTIQVEYLYEYFPLVQGGRKAEKLYTKGKSCDKRMCAE